MMAAMDIAREAPLEEFTKGQLVRMVTEGWVGRVTAAIAETIRTSFAEDQVLRPVLTRDEVRRRFRLCVEGFTTMRRDLGWAVPRILDNLPTYLRHRLDGTPWDPDGGERWVADDPGGEALEIDAAAEPLGGEG